MGARRIEQRGDIDHGHGRPWQPPSKPLTIDGAKVQFSSGARLGANLGTNGKLYATGGYTFGQIDDPYVGAGYQHKLTQNVYGKVEYRHQFINNFDDTDAFAVGVGFAF